MEAQGIDQWKPQQFTLEGVQSYFAYREVFIIFANQEPAAMFTLQKGDLEYWGNKNSDDYFYLHRLTVRESYRKLGLGEAIVHFAISYADREWGLGFRLDCQGNNMKLNRFYQKLGFRFMGTGIKNQKQYNLYQWKNYSQNELQEAIDFVYSTKEDLQYLQQWSSSERFQVQWAGGGWDYPISQETFNTYLSRVNIPGELGEFVYTVVHRLTGKPIGYISLGQIDPKQETARIRRVILGETEYRGRGIGKQMLEEITRIGFEVLELHRISLGVFDFNTSAIRTYTSVGFKQEGILREAVPFHGEYWNLVEMAILQHEWAKKYQ
nr:GNAT family N-acetyltransferase [Paenibacillus shirakamiensis]